MLPFWYNNTIHNYYSDLVIAESFRRVSCVFFGGICARAQNNNNHIQLQSHKYGVLILNVVLFFPTTSSSSSYSHFFVCKQLTFYGIKCIRRWFLLIFSSHFAPHAHTSFELKLCFQMSRQLPISHWHTRFGHFITLFSLSACVFACGLEFRRNGRKSLFRLRQINVILMVGEFLSPSLHISLCFFLFIHRCKISFVIH